MSMRRRREKKRERRGLVERVIRGFWLGLIWYIAFGFGLIYWKYILVDYFQEYCLVHSRTLLTVEIPSIGAPCSILLTAEWVTLLEWK